MSMFGNLTPGGNNNRRTGTRPADQARENIYTGAKYGTPVAKPVVSPFSLSTWEARARAEKTEKAAPASQIGMAVQSPSPMDMPKLIGQGMRVITPKPPTRTTTGGGSGVSSLFAPLFQALDQQLANAQNRYSENAGQIQNIYGQLIGARKADITDIQTAYDRLQKAAASRGAATLEGMETREETRLSQNEAVLESMGVGDIGTSTGDIASQSAAVAQDVERMNQSNWANMLTAMGATSQDIARADMTSFGYAQMEDLAALQGARENFAQNIEQQRFDLKFQEQQARLQAQQAAAAAAARARSDAARAAAQAEEQQYERTTNFLKGEDPVGRAVGSAVLNGLIDANQGQNVVAAFNDWSSKSSVATNTMTNGLKAWQDAQKFIGNRLSGPELNVLRQAVINSFKK